MNQPKKDTFQILKLSNVFYNTYPNPPFIEILKKRQRAYNCILFQTAHHYYICVPYRTEISHTYSYLFKNTERARKHKSGLDYTKIVIINNVEYLDTKNAIVDKDEYNETVININKIKQEAIAFVDDYVAHINSSKCLHNKEYERRYKYSPLKYFHSELGL